MLKFEMTTEAVKWDDVKEKPATIAVGFQKGTDMIDYCIWNFMSLKDEDNLGDYQLADGNRMKGMKPADFTASDATTVDSWKPSSDNEASDKQECTMVSITKGIDGQKFMPVLQWKRPLTPTGDGDIAISTDDEYTLYWYARFKKNDGNKADNIIKGNTVDFTFSAGNAVKTIIGGATFAAAGVYATLF